MKKANLLRASATMLLASVSLALNAGTGNYNIPDGDAYGYLFCHMSSYGQWTAYALSPDGIHFHDLVCGDAVFPARDAAKIEGGMRDPYICRTHDGKGYLMVSSDNNSKYRLAKDSPEDNYGLVLLKSGSLTSWNSVSVDFRDFPGLESVSRVWGPQIIWNDAAGAYMVYYSMYVPGRDPYNRIYRSYADESFSSLSAPQLMADPGFGVTDPEIISTDKGFMLVMSRTDGNGLVMASSNRPEGPWSAADVLSPEQATGLEGFSSFKVSGEEGLRLAYFSSSAGVYRTCRTNGDFGRFFSIQDIEGIDGPQNGSFLALTKEEYESLQAWSDSKDEIYIRPSVKNPVFPGLYADPEALYSQKTGKYYIFPTTDGSYGWHNFDFHCFSSSDFKNWKDEGVILDLRNLDWGKEYAWAPCIIEKPVYKGWLKKKLSGYKYYFYFVANKSIGVAVADSPEGPYKDALGKPLISQEEINSPNICIDPDVFQDPKTGKYYLYWGNSYMWMAELADDMVSFVPGTMHEMIPRSKTGEYHYLEGTYVFERNGLYYFMWSENITRSVHYRVRYLISDSPTEFVRNGKPAKVEEDIILQLNPDLQIFGTGHNAVIRMPGTDEWYMVYHRFTRPEGVKMGLSGGYNREICIDKMEFNADGTIVPVRPTL